MDSKGLVDKNGEMCIKDMSSKS